MSYIRNITLDPVLCRVSTSVSVSRKLSEILPTLTPQTPILLQAGTGAGKTRAILETLVPFAIEHSQRICFVSSRCAINLQFKRNLARTVGEERLLTDYTDEGLRKLEIIGPVQILTYHALQSKRRAPASNLQSFDFLIFDEIHALALDASFVPFTGELLENIPAIFSRARRIYLSATPAPILEPLLRSEGSRQLTIYRWRPDYSSFRLHFYASLTDLAAHFKKCSNSEKVLAFMPSIKMGESFSNMFPGECELVNSHTRQDDPVEWARLLSEQTLTHRFTVTTNVLDAGVSITDPSLKHIVCSGLDIAEILQQAGRKRLKSGESLNLYLWSPSRKSLGNLLQKDLEIIEASQLCSNNPLSFVQRFLIDDENPSVRAMCYLDSTGRVNINSLAYQYTLNHRDLLQNLLNQKSDHPSDSYFCRLLEQALPKDGSRWLDGRYNTDTKKEFLDWTRTHLNIPMDKDKQAEFAYAFKARYQAAYGRRKNDRADRSWGLSVIKNVLQELNWGIQIESTGGFWRLFSVCSELEKAKFTNT